MKFKPVYFFAPLVVVALSSIGKYYTSLNLAGWYASLQLPAWVPPGWLISVSWSLIYVTGALSFILFWNRRERKKFVDTVTILFLSNAALNALWTFIFFERHQIGLSVWYSVAIWLSIVAIIALLWRQLRWSAYLLFPYLAWMTFVIPLNYVIWVMNR